MTGGAPRLDSRSRLLGGLAGRAMLSSTALALGVSLVGSARAATVNPVQTTTYNLTPANNPITFGSGTYINTPNVFTSAQIAVNGASGTSWDVTNQGKIQGGAGILLGTTSSTVVNSGTVTALGLYRGAVFLGGGGSVTNLSGARIAGYVSGVEITGGSGMVTNAGVIAGTGPGGLGTGIVVDNGQTTVDNQAGGLITGGNAGIVGAASVTNAGSIVSTGASGNQLGTGVASVASLTNLAGGTITGAKYGAGSRPADGVTTVTNAGVITGTAVTGVNLARAGVLTNQSGGVIVGGQYGVVVQPGLGPLPPPAPADEVINAGTISGGVDSVVFKRSDGGNTLILQTGSTLIGDAVGSAAPGATNALILEGTGDADNNFDNFTTLNATASGVWTLNGVSSVGAASVSTGELQVGDATHGAAQLIGNVTVDTGATLSGQGAIVGNVVNNGTVRPGAAIGVMSISGNYVQGSSGVLEIEVTPHTGSTLAVTGTATLDGELELVTAPGFYRRGAHFDVLNASAFVGTFSSLVATNGAHVSVDVSAGVMTATLNSGAFTPASATANQTAIAAAFANYPVGVSDFDPVVAALVNLPTAAQQDVALDRLGDEIDADFLALARDNARAFMDGVGDQLAASGAAGGGRSWGYVTGGSGSVASDGAHGFSQRSGGVVFGGDRAWGPDAVLGAAFSYQHGDISLSGVQQSGDFDQVSGGLYGERRFGAFFLDGVGMLSGQGGESSRTIAIANISRRASGQFDGWSAGAKISLGVRLPLPGGLMLEPTASIADSAVNQAAFTETGATGADLAVNAQDWNTVESLLGARLYESIPLGSGAVNVEGRVAWAHELAGVAPIIGESFAAASGTDFSVAGADSGRNFAMVGAGLTYVAAGKVSVFARYDGAFSRRESEQFGSLGVTIAW